MEVESMRPETSAPQIPLETSTERETSTWSFERIPLNPVNIRGGGCIPSTLCDSDGPTKSKSEQEPPLADTVLQLAESKPLSNTSQEEEQEQEEGPVHTSWPGWAELENDPENFTILLQEWGMRSLLVNEVLDVTDLLDLDSSSIFGLIFLSRYVAPDQSRGSTPSQPANTVTEQPWFANQISKFSCGTVALMNILMNASSAETSLSEVLSDFRNKTNDMNAKNRGVTLDNHAQFRDIHNSFSTKLDRYIVDTLLREDSNKAKQKAQAQARNATKKRKRGGVTFTKRRKPKQTYEDDEENGFHFVAYVSAHGHVWKLDGMQAEPGHVGPIDEGQTWLNVAINDVLPRLGEALDAGEQCTMMSVTNSEGAFMISEDEKTRKQEDWAPFIETLIRIHAEKGDLNEMLGLS